MSSVNTYPECDYCYNRIVCFRLLEEGKVQSVSEIFDRQNYEGEPYCENLEVIDGIEWNAVKPYLDISDDDIYRYECLNRGMNSLPDF